MSKMYTSANDFAVIVAQQEGLKKSIDIAQIKEVMRIMSIQLRKCGVDIYYLIASTPKEVFHAKTSRCCKINR